MSDQECFADFIDGNYDFEGCGCDDCCESLHDGVESRVETGDLTDNEARDEHANLSARGY
jgi:hypothetical protein